MEAFVSMYILCFATRATHAHTPLPHAPAARGDGGLCAHVQGRRHLQGQPPGQLVLQAQDSGFRY